MHQQCKVCDARCCRYFCFAIENPCTYEEFEQVRWYLTHEGISIHVDGDGQWWIFIANRCQWLVESPDGPLCRHYQNRPLICRRFDPETCEFTKGPYECEAKFASADELEAYARQVLGEEEFEAERAKLGEE